MVADHELPRPISGAAVAIAVSGSKTGLANAPLLERPLGRGTIVHSQLKLVEKSAIEPAAAVILSNLLAYLGDYQPRNRKTAVLGGDAQYQFVDMEARSTQGTAVVGYNGRYDADAHLFATSFGWKF